ncbi:MAG TPA: tetratricopeptide repeat protein, partial [Candidatus Polarisedimenticolia bacterium]|nr:tetratricopeptide repeat protein [Candidatus Polarisedimenticolia bacterium]
APLRSYDPMISPLLWTTMVTGVGPDLHGVADFQAIDDATGKRVPITGRFRKVKALWNILSDAGRSSAFVAWWASYPAEKVNGVQVSNLVVYETLRPKPAGSRLPPGIAFPDDYFPRIRPALHTAADLTFEEMRAILRIDRDEFEAARREVLAPPTSDEESANRRIVQHPVPLAISILTGSKNYATIAADLAAGRRDLTAVYFEGIDMMGHRFQHCLPPRLALCPDADFARYRDAVTSFYVVQDRLLGPILEAAGSGATVLLVSDHGFKTGAGRPVDLLPFTTQQPVEWHDEDGVFILSGPGARRGVRLTGRATLFDIAPTILYLLGLPASRQMPGHPLLEAIDPGLQRAHPPRPPVASYETLGGPREAVATGGPGAEEAEQELLANLRALGYIGGDPGSSPAVGAAPAGGSPGLRTVAPGGAAASVSTGPGAATQVFYHRNLATYFLKQQAYAKAAEQLLLANERQRLPKNYQMLAEAYSGMGRTDEAIAALERGLKEVEGMDPESVLWMVQIRLASPSGRTAALGVARRWASVTAARPGLDDAIAALLAENGGDPGAAALYRRALAADPTRVIAAQRLYALEGAREGAGLEPILRGALAKDPRIDEYHNLLGAILASTGREREALAELRRATDLDPDNPRFAANLGATLARLGRWEEAAAAYERAAAIEPSPATFMKLGSVYRRLARPEKALACFERARDLGEGGSGPVLGIALAQAEMHRLPEALATVRLGLERHPDDRALRELEDDLVRRTRTPGSAPGRPGSGR